MILGGNAAIDEARGSTHMGRGRAKAKQTKVARDLKYRPVNTDFASLERELRTNEDSGHSNYDEPDYSDLADRYAVDDDEFDDQDELDDADDEQDLRRTS